MGIELPAINKRIKEVIERFADGNISKFSKTLPGISQQRLDRLFKLDSRTKKIPGVPESVITAICTIYPVDSNWLLTGEGEMIIGDKDKNVSLSRPNDALIEPKPKGVVPYYPNITLTGGAVEVYNGSKSIDIVYINLGDAFSDATGAMQVNGHSMYPNYENGSIVGYREVVDKSYLFYGEVYIVGTADYQMLKRIRQSNKEGFIVLASDNKEKDENGRALYSPVEIEMDKIRFLAIVIGKISRSQMKLIK